MGFGISASARGILPNFSKGQNAAFQNPGNKVLYIQFALRYVRFVLWMIGALFSFQYAFVFSSTFLLKIGDNWTDLDLNSEVFIDNEDP